MAVQLKEDTGTLQLKTTAAEVKPEQMVWLLRENVMTGVGFTFITHILGIPLQPFKKGVTKIVSVNRVPPVFTATNPGMLSMPCV